MHPIRLVLADDHSIVLEGLKRLLESDFELAGTASDGRELVAAVVRLRPDVAVVDISMPGLNGLEAARQIRQVASRTKIVFLTVHADPNFVFEALRAGALGYVLKRSAPSEIVEAIRRACGGLRYISPSLPRDTIDSLLRSGTHRDSPFGLLTARQREILQLVAEGKTGKEIATTLRISRKTVEFHKGRIMDRLGMRTTAELTRYAMHHGLATR